MANIIIHLATASAVLIGGGSSAGWAQVVKVQHSVPYESVTESERLYQEDRAETIRGVVESIDKVTSALTTSSNSRAYEGRLPEADVLSKCT